MIGSQERTGDDGGAAAWLPRTPAAAGEEGGTTALIQYLAVFILLLGFFILLNSLARLDASKAGRVMQSVEAAFSLAPDADGRATDRLRAGSLAEASRAVRELGDLFQTEIPVAKVAVSADGRTLAVVMPAAELLEPTATGMAVRADRVALLHRTADVLQPREGAVQVRMEGLMSTTPGRSPPPGAEVLVGGAGALARGLTHHGAPASALTVGLETGGAGELRLLFGVTVAGRPVALVEEAAR